MRLHKLKVKNFRKLKEATIFFRDATFLIGPNNTGKSSLFDAVQYLHKATNVNREDYSKTYSETDDDYVYGEEIEIVAEYRNIPDEAESWLGFRGRIMIVDDPVEGETNKSIEYKKVWSINKTKPDIFMREYPLSTAAPYIDCKKVSDLVGNDFSEDFLKQYFGEGNYNKALTIKTVKEKLRDLPQYWDIENSETKEWVQNPGGIPGNVLSKLPRVVIIPAESCASHLTSKNGPLLSILGELFENVRKDSENYQQAQVLLNNLAQELNPSNDDTDFGKLMSELNSMTHRLFPDSAIHVDASLDQPEKNIKPIFNVEMESNVKTAVPYQGHGMIRATAFQLLRFVQEFANRNSDTPRTTIFCFEEPEIFLHPSAANQMRDAIYDLASSGCQIIATTHSPYMVNLGSDKTVSLNKFFIMDDGFSNSRSMNIDAAFETLQADEKQNLKMLLKVDDYISRMFFTKKSIFVEGDTEEVVIRETLRRLPIEHRARVIGNLEFLRARGKPVLISIAKYLNALGLEYHIIHDRDQGTQGAETINNSIRDAAGENQRTMLKECVEDILGYPAPSSDKPFKAYKMIQNEWGSSFDDIPENWRILFINICSPYLDEI